MVNLVSGLVAVGFLFALFFGSAGRWDLPLDWAYFALYLALMLARVCSVDPDLQRERLRPAHRGRDLLPVMLGTPLYLAHYVVAGLDVGRFHWSDGLAPAVQIAGLVFSAGGWALVWWAMVVNRFFVTTVRIQTERGHHLVEAGPYRYVRHPGYAGMSLGFLASPIALGSWSALIPMVPAVLLIIRRAVVEDRLLHQELQGYPEYAARVRHRLLPGIW
jgi:protein-S-isoprenylcysteine O-methyltransferase Ste14